MSENRRPKLSDNFVAGSRPIHRKRIIIIMAAATILFAVLILRTAWHQIIKGEELYRAALEQQTSDNTVRAKRGKIYDRNYKV